MSKLYAMQQDLPDTGRLLVNVSSMISSRAVSGATVQITDSNEPEDVIDELSTDSNGQDRKSVV